MNKHSRSYVLVTKRFFDFFLSLFMIIIFTFLVIIPVSIFIKVTSKGPVFFKQIRIGKNNKKFTLYKFRTMRIDAPHEVPTHLLDNPEKWITPVGHILRKTSIDEIPQFFNVLKGEMSIVGPRPALWNQYDLIDERYRLGISSLKPGITGWAQINGRDKLTIKQKIDLDYYYLSHASLFLDILIIFKTFFKFFRDPTVIEGKSNNFKS